MVGRFQSAAAVTNSAILNFDQYATGLGGGDGGSSLTISGTLTNSGTGSVQVGNGSLSGTTTISLGGLVNGASESFKVQGQSSHFATFFFSNGGAGFTSNAGVFDLSYTEPLALAGSFNNTGTFGIHNITVLSFGGSCYQQRNSECPSGNILSHWNHI